jgi:hypothetical protein
VCEKQFSVLAFSNQLATWPNLCDAISGFYAVGNSLFHSLNSILLRYEGRFESGFFLFLRLRFEIWKKVCNANEFFREKVKNSNSLRSFCVICIKNNHFCWNMKSHWKIRLHKSNRCQSEYFIKSAFYKNEFQFDKHPSSFKCQSAGRKASRMQPTAQRRGDDWNDVEKRTHRRELGVLRINQLLSCCSNTAEMQ